MENFLLILTVCGSLHTGGFGCDEFVIDQELSQVECLTTIKGVYNGEPMAVRGVMNDAVNDWFVSVSDKKLDCVIEDKG